MHVYALAVCWLHTSCALQLIVESLFWLCFIVGLIFVCLVLKFKDEFLLRGKVCNATSNSDRIPCSVSFSSVLILVVGV